MVTTWKRASETLIPLTQQTLLKCLEVVTDHFPEFWFMCLIINIHCNQFYPIPWNYKFRQKTMGFKANIYFTCSISNMTVFNCESNVWVKTTKRAMLFCKVFVGSLMFPYFNPLWKVWLETTLWLQWLPSINVSEKHYFIGVDYMISWAKVKPLKITEMFKNCVLLQSFVY